MSDAPKYVTLKDIAKVCGVTTTTVSLAMRNHPRISDATKQKVQEAAKELGYSRHPMLSALMANLSQSRMPTDLMPLAAVYTHKSSIIETNEFHRKIWKGMDERARELGFKVEPFFLGDSGMSGSRLQQILKARGISGVVVPPLLRPGGYMRLDWSDFSAVAVGYSMSSPSLNRVCPDQYNAIRLVLRKLRRMNYQRPGLLLHKSSDVRTLNLYSSGFLGDAYAHGVTNSVPILEVENEDPKTFSKWFDSNRPDVIISSDLSVAEVVDKAGLKYPDDVGLVSLSGLTVGCGVAGIDQRSKSLGASAVERLVEMMYYNKRGIPDAPYVLQIPPNWKDGASLLVK